MEPRRGQLVERGQQRSRVGVERCARARRRPTTPAGRRPSSPRGTGCRRRRRRPPVARRIGARGAAAARPAARSARRSPGRAWPRSATGRRGAGRPPRGSARCRPRPPGPRRAPSRAALSLRSGISIATAVPSAAAPRYGATSGSGSGNGVAAMKPSRSAWSRVERAIQSTAQDVRLSTNAAPSEGRTSRVSDAPDQPSLGNAASGASVSPCSASRSGSVRPSQCLSTGRGRRPRHPARRPGRRRANPGSCGSARRRAARGRTRSPRRGSRRPGCRRSRRPPPRTRAPGRSGHSV